MKTRIFQIIAALTVLSMLRRSVRRRRRSRRRPNPRPPAAPDHGARAD